MFYILINFISSSPWLFSTGDYEKAKWNVFQIGQKYFPDSNIDKNFVEQLTVQMEKAESEEKNGRHIRDLHMVSENSYSYSSFRKSKDSD